MSDITNNDLASWTAAAIALIVAQSGLDDIADYAVSDLIADIGHYCDANDIDYLEAIARAIAHWHAESRPTEGEDIGYMPAVCISIDGGVP